MQPACQQFWRHPVGRASINAVPEGEEAEAEKEARSGRREQFLDVAHYGLAAFDVRFVFRHVELRVDTKRQPTPKPSREPACKPSKPSAKPTKVWAT